MPFIGNQPALSYTSFAKQDFTTSATTSYTLDNPVANANELALFINFVRQEPTASYSASGTTLTLTEATSVGDDMYCVYLGKAVQTVNPPNSSVGLSQLSATGTKDSTTFLRGDNSFQTVSSYADSDALSLFNASGSAPVYACRSWVNFNGTGTVAIRGSGNVTSITDSGVGRFEVNFTTAMPDVNYCASIGTPTTAGSGLLYIGALNTPGSWTSSKVYTRFINSNITYWDPEVVCVSIFR